MWSIRGYYEQRKSFTEGTTETAHPWRQQALMMQEFVFSQHRKSVTYLGESIDFWEAGGQQDTGG